MKASPFALLPLIFLLLGSPLASAAYRQPLLFDLLPSDITVDQQNGRLVVLLHGRFPQGFEKPEFLVSCGSNDMDVQADKGQTPGSDSRGATLTFSMQIPPAGVTDCTVQVKDYSEDARDAVGASKSLPRAFRIDASKLPAAAAPSADSAPDTSASAPAPAQTYAPAPSVASTPENTSSSTLCGDDSYSAGYNVDAQLILATVTSRTPPVCEEVTYEDSWGDGSISSFFSSLSSSQPKKTTKLECSGGGSEQFVTGLQQEDFEVYAGSQRLTDQFEFKFQQLPTTLGILLDASGSMIHFNKRQHAVEAAQRLIEAIGKVHDDKRDSNAFVVNFNGNFFFNDMEKEEPREYCSLRHAAQGDVELPATQSAKTEIEKTANARLTDDLAGLAKWSDLVNQSGDDHSIPLAGGTRMRDAIDRAVDQIRWGRNYDGDNPSPELKAHQNKIQELLDKYTAEFTAQGKDPTEAARLAGDKAMPGKSEIIAIDAIRSATDKVRPRAVLFVISDGVDTESQVDFPSLVAHVRDQDIQVYGINFAEAGSDPSRNELVRLAKVSGGQAISIPEDASDSTVRSEAGEFTSHVIQMLQNQYSLGFREQIRGCQNLRIVARDYAAGQPKWLKTVMWPDYERDKRAFDLDHLPKDDSSEGTDMSGKSVTVGLGSHPGTASSSGSATIGVGPVSASVGSSANSSGVPGTPSYDWPHDLPKEIAKAAEACFANSTSDTYLVIPKFGRVCSTAEKLEKRITKFVDDSYSTGGDDLDKLQKGTVAFRNGKAYTDKIEELRFNISAYAIIAADSAAAATSSRDGNGCNPGCDAVGQACVCGMEHTPPPPPEYMSFKDWLAGHEKYGDYLARMKKAQGATFINSFPPLTVYTRQMVGDCPVSVLKSALEDPGSSDTSTSGNKKRGSY